jgi:predicted lysophospholipase L1 biosynthesis ABC-type transport system permease subunit
MKPGDFNGFKVLWAGLIGAAIGVVLAIFIDAVLRNTPADLSPGRVSYLYGVVVAAAALFSTAIESMRQLQESSPEAEYRQSGRRSHRR